MKVRSTHKKHRGLKVIFFLLCGSLLAAGLLFFYFYIYRVVPVFSEAVCEYGDPLSQSITDYLSGSDWSVHLGELDLSQVDEAHTGVYQAVVYHGGTTFTYTITIQDTVPPEILWREEQVCVASDTLCLVEDVIEGVSDADPLTEVFFCQDGEEKKDIRFEQVGEYELEVCARDRAGNESRGRVRVIVDTPPELEGIHNFYCVPGSEPDYLDTVTAWDEVDGDLTGQIRVDDSEVQLDREGIYPLCYLAEDSYGLETMVEARIMVAEAEDIQELIGWRQIDYRKDTILGAPNVYDAGVAEQEDLEETLEYMRPTMVHLYYDKGRGGYSSGSGYIMEITEDAVYICSNRHVVEKNEEWDIYFYDGTKVKGRVLGVSEGYDVGVVVVNRGDVPRELLRRLMTVHIDRTYWEGLDQQGLEVALERIDREGGLIHVSTGNLVKIKQLFEWNEEQYHTEVTVELVHGDSGSAIIDGYGNLICMAYAFSVQPTRYWCVPLDGILDSYAQITGHVPYVY